MKTIKTHHKNRYEKIHALYMATSVFSTRGAKLKRLLWKTRGNYIKETKINFPGIIVF